LQYNIELLNLIVTVISVAVLIGRLVLPVPYLVSQLIGTLMYHLNDSPLKKCPK
jgi:hypothetical protein